MHKKVLVFGNEIVNFDALPVKLIPVLSEKLPEFEFDALDPNEQLENQGKNLLILDTVLGIKKVTVFTEKDLAFLETEKRFSAHDFDLGFSLRFLLKLKKIESVKILGVPPRYDKEKAVEEIGKLLNSLKY